MRITENIKFSNIQFNIRQSTERYFNANERVISGKKINRPSDDPAGAHEVLRLKSLESSAKQYGRNMNRAINVLQTTESLLENVNNRIVRAKELAVRESTGTENSESREMAAIEVSGILDEVLSIANTRIDGKYIFSGFKTASQPFDPADPAYAYNGDGGLIEIAVDENRQIPVNLTGDILFKGSGGGVDILSELDALKTALENNDIPAITSAIDTMEAAMDQVSRGRVEAGTRLSEIEVKKGYLESFKLNLLSRISTIEDVDIAEAITDLTRMQHAYTATLGASSRFMQVSLMDFLR